MSTVKTFVVFAVLCFCTLAVSRKEYTHRHFWIPAHREFREALAHGDLARAAVFLEREKRYEMYGLDPLWFIEGTEK